MRPCRIPRRTTQHTITISTEGKYSLRTCMRGAGSKAKTTRESQATNSPANPTLDGVEYQE